MGCGAVGRKRAATLPEGSLVAACDLDLSRAQALAGGAKAAGGTALATTSLADTLSICDAVIVSALNCSLAPITAAAIRAGRHALVEKPAGISVREIEELQELAANQHVAVRVGYNHRYHPSLQKAREIVDSGVLGQLMYVRGRYGHGGRVGYDSEWRADPKQSGGGELIDQGVHLIDLAGWFLGSFTSLAGHAETYFWKMPVDDNAFLDLKTESGQTAWLHVSCSEWKNLFSFEIYGRGGKLHIEGLGGSYGVERLSFYRMLPKMGPPETVIYEYPGADVSWHWEMEAFLLDIETGRAPSPGLAEALAAMRVVEAIYAQ